MKKIFLLAIYTLLLTSCITFEVSPQPFPVWTVIPSRTPAILTATPLILTPTPGIVITDTPTLTSSPFPTETPTLFFTNTPTQAVQVDILGCNTSIDIVHSMGEVTNAYVTVKNTGTIDLPNT